MKTFDLGMAAAIKTLTDDPVTLEADPNRAGRVAFVFPDSTMAEYVVDSFLTQDVSVPARAYFNALKNLKSAVFQFQGRN